MALQRRNITRKSKRVRVRYGVDKLEKSAFTRNVSESGLFIASNNVFKPGTTLQVELQFPERKFSFWARVVWAKKVPPQLAHVVLCGMGCYFIHPHDDWPPFFAEWSGFGGGETAGNVRK